MSILGGIMVPHPPLIMKEVGRGKELEIKDTIMAYEKASKFLKDLNPETIILISPHSESYIDYFEIYDGDGASGNMAKFGAPEVKFSVNYDKEFINKLNEKLDFGGSTGKFDKELDHGMMVPLYFINSYVDNYKLVRIPLSGLSLDMHYKLGMIIKEVAEELNKRVAIVASGDLSHKLKEDGPYGFVSEGPIYDEKVMNDMSSGNFLNLLEYEENFLDTASICGHPGFCIMGGAFDKSELEVERLSYEGPFGVGYGICTYKVVGDNTDRNFLDKYYENRLEKIKEIRNNEDMFVSLARKTIEEYVKYGTRYKLLKVPEEMKDKRGVFVSIHKNGELRGCIGTIEGMYSNISEEIISNAISASCRDNRFKSIDEDELEYLDYSVDVLGEKEDCTKEDLDPKKYGIVIEKDGHRGVLLPNLDGVDTVDKQISITLRKAGLSPLEEDYSIKRFEVIRHF